MARTSRILLPDAFYHVMNRGGARRAIYRDDDQKRLFLDLLEESENRFKSQVHAYCLMGNHFHLLLRTPELNLSEAMHWITNQYSRRVNQLERFDGSIFRGRFKAIIIDAEDYLVQVSRYIHLNPVKAKLCSKPSDYPWSSYAAYLDGKKRPPWLHVNEVLRRVGGSADEESYASLVENPLLPSLDEFYRPGRPNSILGSKQFKKYLLGTIGSSHQALRSSSLAKNHVVTFARIRDVILHDSTNPNLQITSSCQGSKRQERNIAMYLAEKYCDASLVEIAGWFEVTPSAVSIAIKRLKDQCLKTPELNSRVQVLEMKVEGQGLQPV